MRFILSGVCFLLLFVAQSQTYIVKDIRSFGAKGNGKTNDQAAFEKAADYFNQRGGNGKLIISKGTYIVGNQSFTGGQQNKPAYTGETVMIFKNIKDFNVTGKAGSLLKYAPGLHFGSFSPATGEIYNPGKNFFVDRAYLGVIGYCILLDNCKNIIISGITMDGNSGNLILGGNYGDVGRQIPHTGIYILNSEKIKIDKAYIHHFGLDGILISNKESAASDSIQLINSAFDYNSRQGLSWVSGNQLYVKNCRFNHTGKGKFNSQPSAGVDIEAENGPVRNGVFENCEFSDNAGCGVVAGSGDSGDCIFSGCTFRGTTSWSIWVTKPGFSFHNCNIYGAVVHGYSSPSAKDATKFYSCSFEDKLYNGATVYGGYLVVSENAKRMFFSDCSFISNKNKLCWFDNSSASSVEEKYQFTNCSFTINNSNLPPGDFVGVMRGAALKNCTFTFTDPDAKKKRYFLSGYGDSGDADLGGNRIVFKNQ